MNAIELLGLTRHFGGIHAVEDLDLCVSEGEIFGLVGPNGSGKTTTLNVLSTLLRPTRGTARVFGHDLVAEGHRIRPLLGVTFHQCVLDLEGTVDANLRFVLRMQGVPGRAVSERVGEALAVSELEDVRHRIVGELSWGLKRRVEIARALSGNPRLLLLDEPTQGLDTDSSQRIRRILDDWRNREGAIVFLCTHDGDLMELCDRLGLLVEGRLRRVVDTPSLRREIGEDEIVFTTRTPECAVEALAWLTTAGVSAVSENGQVKVKAPQAPRWVGEFMAAMDGRLKDFSYSRARLKDCVSQLVASERSPKTRA